MKRYNLLILVSVMIYILSAFAAAYGVYGFAADREKGYKVEINRIYNSLSGGKALDKLDLHSYQAVRNVSYLSCEEIKDKEKTENFYKEGNQFRMEIRPLYGEGQLLGFLRFDYQESSFHLRYAIIVTELALFLMEVFTLWILFYLKFRLVAPFQKMSSLPYEMAKGHLGGIVTEEKNKYFGQFLWGLGQLKDTLEVSKKREMELQKEKKILLLSLSHDIKTPLNTIKLYGKALEEDLYDEEGQKRHAVRQIGAKAAEIESYIEEIMKNTREDILDIQVSNGEFYLAGLIKKVLDTYQEKCNIRMIDLKIAEYENRLLKGDLERTLEVFGNIFENAFKYGDGRRIEITFYEEDYCQLIRIYNTGVPVTDNEFNHIFESFFRGEGSRGKQGNGLGLYICREIMRKMGGEIFAEKQEGGMAFVLVFS